MPGWRVGWVIGPKTLVEHLGRLALCMLYGLPGFIQQAAMTALENRPQIVADMREIYRRRRDIVFDRLRDVPGLHCLLPEAGMFMMVDVTGTGLSAYDFSWQLFRAQGVSVLDASAFGETAAGFVRLGFVLDEARLAEACDRIATFVASIRR
jgi:arginine:pyruvate transaminase